MNSNQQPFLTPEQAFEFIVDLLDRRSGYQVRDLERFIFIGNWRNLSYQEILREYNINTCQLRQLQNIGSDFWRMLTDTLGQRFSMGRIHVPVGELWRQQQQEEHQQHEQDETETRLLNPQNPHPPSDQGDEAGSEHGALSPKTSSTNHQHFFLKRIVLIVEEPENITKENLSRELRIQPVREFRIQPVTSLWEMLGLIDDPSGGSWEDLVSRLPEENRRWSEQLQETIYQAIRLREIPQEIQLPFRSSDGRLFRPLLDAINTLNGSKQFIFILLPVPSEGWVYNAPNLKLATIVTALALGPRLEWGVCRKFLPELKKLQGRQQEDTTAIKSILRQIEISFASIEAEAEFRRQGEIPNLSLRNEDRLREAFDLNEQNVIALNLSEQQQYKEILLQASNQHDIDRLINALTELSRLNKIVIRMLAQRLSQLLEQDDEDSP